MREEARAIDLFGEPHRTAELSQFFTPAWVARRAARWVPPGACVLEPSAGRGNLIEALLRNGHPPSQMVACELDPAWCQHLLQRWSWLELYEGSFLELPAFNTSDCDYALTNPPYEEGKDAEHVAHALELTGRVTCIVKADFEYSAERDRVLWRHARVVRRAILVDRPDFGETMEKGSQGAARNYVVLGLVPHDQVGGAYEVLEERWRKTDPEEDW